MEKHSKFAFASIRLKRSAGNMNGPVVLSMIAVAALLPLGAQAQKTASAKTPSSIYVKMVTRDAEEAMNSRQPRRKSAARKYRSKEMQRTKASTLRENMPNRKAGPGSICSQQIGASAFRSTQPDGKKTLYPAYFRAKNASAWRFNG